jgi:hypothetical protein
MASPRKNKSKHKPEVGTWLRAIKNLLWGSHWFYLNFVFRSNHEIPSLPIAFKDLAIWVFRVPLPNLLMDKGKTEVGAGRF